MPADAPETIQRPAAAPRHFLDLDQFDPATLRRMIEDSKAMKRGEHPLGDPRPLAGKTLAMIFEKPSTRTRVSFEVGMRQLGGEPVVLEPSGTQLGRGETIADTARVLSQYVDAIMLRTTAEAKLLELSKYAEVPVINGLTDRTHPCQLMADVLTFEEFRGPIQGRTVVWVGDGNNMATSWLHAAARFDFELRLATPVSLQPPADVLAWARAEGAAVTVTDDVTAAVAGADAVVTDAWVSMGDDAEDTARRHRELESYQVDSRVMALAKPEAIFMHCLPAHRGEEVTEEVIESPRSVIFAEAGNRLHAQKGILLWCLA